jgi:transcriptional regulator with XRE-family HTH domain
MKLARLRKGMKQHVAATFLSISKSYLCMIELGQVPVTEDILKRMSGLYDVPLKKLRERVI